MTLSRGSTLAGHVIVEDNARIGSNAGVVQRSRIGRFAEILSESAVSGTLQTNSSHLSMNSLTSQFHSWRFRHSICASSWKQSKACRSEQRLSPSYWSVCTRPWAPWERPSLCVCSCWASDISNPSHSLAWLSNVKGESKKREEMVIIYCFFNRRIHAFFSFFLTTLPLCLGMNKRAPA